jgi:hypothetical protein
VTAASFVSAAVADETPPKSEVAISAVARNFLVADITISLF